MVLVNLTKLIGFISIIHKTPKEVARRKTRLIEAYNMLEADTTDVVSIKMNSSLERWMKEMHLDDEESIRRIEILEQLIDDYTNTKINLPAESNSSKTYLFPVTTYCNNPPCCKKKLVICRPSRQGPQ